MPVIAKKNNDLLDLSQPIGIESGMVPSVRFLHAKERGNENDFMIMSPDALGDCVCLLPTVEYALKMKGLKVSVATRWPEIFQHLPLENLIDLKVSEPPDENEFYMVSAYPNHDELAQDFFSSFGTQLVDYVAQNTLRQTLPVRDRAINMPIKSSGYNPFDVIIHPGSTWASKTFPKAWWDQVIDHLIKYDLSVAIVGQSGIVDKAGQEKGTVNVEALNCTDLRDKLTILELADVLESAKVVITNDSAPLHIAAAGKAWIGFFATAIRPDNITHWRYARCYHDQPQWGWRMENLALGGLWTDNPMQPNINGARFDKAAEGDFKKWLPEPISVALWAVNKLGLQ